MSALPAGGLPPDHTLMIGPGGKVMPVPSHNAPFLADLGYAQASEKQAADWHRDQEFQTPTQQLKTFAEGVADTVTLGGSTWAEVKSGLATPEDIASRERLNPLVHLAGTATGFAVPIPGAPTLLGKVGRLASEGVGKILAGTALHEAPSLLGKTIAQAAKTGAGSAVEAGLWGAGMVVHERALNPNLSAENALHTIGLSTLLGGTLGGALGAATTTIPAALRAGQDAILGVGEKPGLFAKVSGKLRGEESSTVQDLINAKGDLLSKAPVRKEFSEKLASGFNDRIASDQKLIEEFDKIYGSVPAAQAEAVDSAITRHEEALGDVLNAHGSTKSGKKGTFHAPSLDESLENTIANKRSWENKPIDNWLQSSGDLHNAIEQASKHVPTGEFDRAAIQRVADKTSELLADTRQKISLAQAAERIGSGGEGGMNPFLESATGAMALGHMIPGIGHAVGAMVGPIHAGLKWFNPARAAEVLGWFERANTIAEKTLGKAINGLLKGGEEGGIRVGRPAATLADRFEKETGVINHLGNNPDALVDRLGEVTKDFSDHAPMIAQLLQAKVASSVGFLATRVPKGAKTGPLGAEISPSPKDIRTYMRFHDAVNNPVEAIRNPTPEGMMTLQQLYPEYLSNARTTLLTKLVESKAPVPFAQRGRIGMLLGQPADWSHSPQGVQSIYRTIGGAKPQPGPQMAPKENRGASVPAARAKSLKTGLNSQTAQQASLRPERK